MIGAAMTPGTAPYDFVTGLILLAAAGLVGFMVWVGRKR